MVGLLRISFGKSNLVIQNSGEPREGTVARPKAAELTQRELAVMQVFWQQDDASADEARAAITKAGESLAYVTVANVVRGLADKGFLKQLNQQRPFRYKAIKTFDHVSKRLVGDMVSRLFNGSREAMLVQLLERRKLTREERDYLHDVLQREEGEA